MSIEYSTAKEIIETKIKRNQEKLRLYTVEEMILDHNINIINDSKSIIKQRKDLIREINHIEEQQLQSYSLERAKDIEKITEEVNRLIKNEEKFLSRTYQLMVTRQQCLTIIEQLNEKIPNSSVITNYKINLYDPNEPCKAP